MKGECDMTKDSYIRFRLTESEKELVKQAAERLNMSMSDFARSYLVLISRTVKDVSVGAIGIEIAQDILKYNTAIILKSAKNTTRILKNVTPNILKNTKRD